MKRLLIDAAHADELRVALLDGNRLEDFETETAGKQQLKGNIYLGHVSRVEPSLQAAFITFGGNRNGFLAFGEVHPQFFALDDKEKKALLKELEEQAARRRGKDAEDDEDMEEGSRPQRVEKDRDDKRQPGIHRRYRIQDVLKEGQKIMVQVVKEERGSKGAALTTYFSLPGRYTVLMPNTPHAGGISRKISDPEERQSLKEAYGALKVPASMGLIIRTAGVGQPAAAIKKDYANLLNLWASINETFAKEDDIQCLHEDGSLIIRALRDMKTDDLEEILISGKRTLKIAKDFTKGMMPESARLIKEYKDETPLFAAFKIEEKLTSLFHSRVGLPSGGSMVINPTEALVAVDINSGRATQERNIEETALKTNLEACEELGRQIRLRDLAGLIVVDFIDMEDNRNIRKVENTMRKILRRDRARVQFGRISEFGLMEISRQRLRPSFGESHLIACPHCLGSGLVHSPSSSAHTILRRLEEEDARGADRIFVTTCNTQVVWMFNHKREALRDLESKYKYQIQFRADDNIVAPDHVLELVHIKADGSETTQTVKMTLREQPELPPELRQQQRSQGRGRRRKETEEETPPSRNGRSSNRKEAKSPRTEAEHATAGAHTETTAEKPEKPSSTARRPSRLGNKPPTEADTTAGRKTAPAGKSPAKGKAAKNTKAKNTVRDEPLAVAKVEVDNDTPTIKPAKRKAMKITAEPDTDKADTPLEVQKQSETPASKATPKPASGTAKPKAGSILSRLISRKEADLG